MKFALRRFHFNNTAFSIASQLTWGAQGFITFVMAGRLLLRREFGLVVVSNAILFGCQCLVFGPVTNPTLRFGPLSRKSLRITYYIYSVVTTVVCCVFLMGSGTIGKLIDNDPTTGILIKCLAIPFATLSLYSLQKIVLFSRTHFRTVFIMDALFTATNIAALLFLHAHQLLVSAASFFMTRSFAAVVGLAPALLLYILERRASTLQEEQPFVLRDYFHQSTYSSISMFSSYGQSQVDVLAVSHFLSPLDAGLYGAAKVFYTGMTLITSGLIMVVLPASSRVASSGTGALRNYYRRALLVGYALMLPGGVALAVFAEPILHMLFGARYLGATPIVRLFCLATVVLPASSITDAVANGAGWFRSACAAAIAGGMAGIAVSLVLPRYIGLTGAALAPIAAITITALMILSLNWDRLVTCSAVGSARTANLTRQQGQINSLPDVTISLSSRFQTK